MRVKRNMKRSLENSTRHLTGAIKIIILSLIIITLYSAPTSAITYQDSVDVSFTFDPTLSISLSSNNISIDNLVPGNYAHSNTVTINVSTNSVYGYTLTAKVGEDGGGVGTSASSDLVNASSNTPFTSLSPNDRLILSNFANNTWGYTTSSSINNDSTYSGLLYNTDTILNQTIGSRGNAIGGYAGTNTTNFTIGASASDNQLSGSYSNVITFTVVSNTTPPPTLYELVAAMSKGKQTNDTNANTGIKAAITKTNSGVYEYNSAVFGVASDASNDYPIYYYRGILDEVTGAYGSDGDGKAWPDYVLLDADNIRTTSDTCWRIVRTTGSGGVKVIYNGKWTGHTCANAQTNAQLIISPFNIDMVGTGYSGLQYQNIHAIGYTYSDVAADTTTATALSTLFGNSGDDTTTNTNSSIIKQNTERQYTISRLEPYTTILEPNAGYCNDRTVYPNGLYGITSKLAESTMVIPYGTSNMTAYFYGAWARNGTVSQTPSLNCPRGTVDLYSTTTNGGGNGQLNRPIALLTADEASFAGSGRSNASQGSSYHSNSFLRSGSDFWLLSPYYRSTSGYASGFRLSSSGILDYGTANYTIGVRPVISIKFGTSPTAGSGTATDPWVITAP